MREEMEQFYAIWRQFQGKTDEDALLTCRIAVEFERKLDGMIFSKLTANSSQGQVVQAKYMLQEEWQAWKRSAPVGHRYPTRGQHRCLYEVYDASFERLNVMMLMVHLPFDPVGEYEKLVEEARERRQRALPPNQPSAPVQIPAIFFGELGG